MDIFPILLISCIIVILFLILLIIVVFFFLNCYFKNKARGVCPYFKTIIGLLGLSIVFLLIICTTITIYDNLTTSEKIDIMNFQPVKSGFCNNSQIFTTENEKQICNNKCQNLQNNQNIHQCLSIDFDSKERKAMSDLFLLNLKETYYNMRKDKDFTICFDTKSIYRTSKSKQLINPGNCYTAKIDYKYQKSEYIYIQNSTNTIQFETNFNILIPKIDMDDFIRTLFNALLFQINDNTLTIKIDDKINNFIVNFTKLNNIINYKVRIIFLIFSISMFFSFLMNILIVGIYTCKYNLVIPDTSKFLQLISIIEIVLHFIALILSICAFIFDINLLIIISCFLLILGFILVECLKSGITIKNINTKSIFNIVQSILKIIFSILLLGGSTVIFSISIANLKNINSAIYSDLIVGLYLLIQIYQIICDNIIIFHTIFFYKK